MLEQVAHTPERDWARIGLWLVGTTLASNVIEAAIALASGQSLSHRVRRRQRDRRRRALAHRR